jgi:transcriptional regulator with XRE-family HTH domain
MTTRKRLKGPGARLKALRDERGLTKTALAKEAGCSRYAIHLYEQGDRSPRGDISFRLYLLTKEWGAPIFPTDWPTCA